MPLTPQSNPSAYATPADLLTYHDARSVGQLCNDTDQQLDAAAIALDPVVNGCLDAASGQVEAACTAGGRYRPDDLAALTGVSKRHLVRLVCDLAYYALTARRFPETRPDQLGFAEVAYLALERLRLGEHVFGFVETAEAGGGMEPMTTSTTERLYDPRRVVNRARRFFGAHAGDC